MSNFSQTIDVFQGSSEILRFTAAVAGMTVADVSGMEFVMRKRGTVALTLTQAAGGIIISTDASNVYIDVYLVGSATAALDGVYKFELAGTIDSIDKHRAAGYVTVKEAYLS